MLKVALTGGIGAGKSTVAAKLSQLGARVIDADALSREVVAPNTEGLAAVVSRFGPDVLTADGSLDRAELAKTVFSDPAARAELEAIVHPRVRARARELTDAQPADAIVVQDIPLLAETGQAPGFHLNIDVEAPRELRLERLAERGLSRADALRRIDAQASDAERREVCDVVLDNRDGLHELEHRVTMLWEERIVPYADNLLAGRAETRPEKLQFVESDPAWPRRFERLAARLRRVLGPSAVRIDHVGSTAVAGLPAKDVIDIQVTVVSLRIVDAFADDLGEAGFFGRVLHDSPKPEYPDEADWEKRFYGYADPGNIAHVHFRPIDSPGQRFALLFRDWMRADATSRADYAQAKGVLAAKVDSTTGYTEAKEPWFDREAWPRANRWAAETGWQPPVC
ncbi:dephospho-CoA kinase [Glycomyces sp. TRM65418]|uniref:dephospho-CoA kinase n=1 Tax=Glycomyces sp. TRM65418 TaxID=2867006 RepID=UPI001CE52FD0|nr:dephospho-CoA kinase [Glycomyces sp. TRM65418]MCC3761562.1 dephospho-CoA kinase [Glycomyces sp. TRM65418]QZD55660.1 dephospho-CoA kinase [Glycomyces sp. TRM65418]